jgi:hypothetical protein
MKPCLAKKQFFMSRVVSLLVLGFIGVAGLTYTAVNIAYTFISGTTAKASEVNADFQTLAKAIPAAKTTYLTSPYIIPDYPDASSAMSLTVTIPAPGKVFIFAPVNLCIVNHTLGGQNTAFLQVSKTANTIDPGLDITGPALNHVIPSSAPTFSNFNFLNYSGDQSCLPFTASFVFNELSAGTITYYLNAMVQTTAGPHASALISGSLTALYVPSALPIDRMSRV